MVRRSTGRRVETPSPEQMDRARRIGEILDTLFPDPEIPLAHQDPFTLLCAVLLSAQCTDVRVNEVTPQLFERARTPEAMQALPLEELEELLRPCGLYRTKARALKTMATQLIARHGGQVPAELEALEQLAGVGHKTASVVLVQAFHQPAFAVDTHIARAAQRWGLCATQDVDQVEENLKQMFPAEQWARRHLQIIFYCRTHCPARGHRIEHCPICMHLSEELAREGKQGRAT